MSLSKNILIDNDTVWVSVELTNIGKYDGDEVVQLYVKHKNTTVGRPNIELKGFTREHIASGDTKIITIPLYAHDLGYWNARDASFTLEDGKIELYIGSSSHDPQLHKELIISKNK